MTLMRLLAAWTIIVISVAPSLGEPPRADLYVAPTGNDANPGTAEAPLATIARARDLFRPRIAAGLPPMCWWRSAAAPIAWMTRWSSDRKTGAPAATRLLMPSGPARRSC